MSPFCSGIIKRNGQICGVEDNREVWCSDWKRGQNCAPLSRRWKCLTAPLPKRQVLDDELFHCSDIWKTEGQDLLPVLISQECGVASNMLRILFRLVFIQRDSQIETHSPRFLEIHSMDGSVCVSIPPSLRLSACSPVCTWACAGSPETDLWHLLTIGAVTPRDLPSPSPQYCTYRLKQLPRPQADIFTFKHVSMGEFPSHGSSDHSHSAYGVNK